MNESANFKCDNCGVLDHVLIDGYGFGDTLLEEVYFEIRWKKGQEGKAVEAKVEKSSADYFSQLNQKMFLRQAEEYALKEDVATCPKCRQQVDGPALYTEAPAPSPKPVKTTRPTEVFGKKSL